VDELLQVDPEDWEQELVDSKEFFQKFGERLPREIREEHEKLSGRLESAAGVAR
jgi:phosphoenolpyruvate carboxykinase (GTP)